MAKRSKPRSSQLVKPAVCIAPIVLLAVWLSLSPALVAWVCDERLARKNAVAPDKLESHGSKARISKGRQMEQEYPHKRVLKAPAC
jgi:hypothetical protein